MSEEITEAERAELAKLRAEKAKEEKHKKMSRNVELVGVILHIVLCVVIAVSMMSNGFSPKAAWSTGFLAPLVLWWLLSCPILW